MNFGFCRGFWSAADSQLERNVTKLGPVNLHRYKDAGNRKLHLCQSSIFYIVKSFHVMDPRPPVAQ
jgi:hypothetical protein